MEQTLSVWNALGLGRRVVVVLATVAVFATVLALGRMASQPTMALLYAGLEPQSAAAVVAALEGQGAVYEVRGNALYVEAARRDALRLTLAGEGLPATGSQGYELLDALTGFGTTAQMFDAAYWRAKEGELARTITASPHVRSARVHLAVPAGRPFRRNELPSASVTVATAGGALSVSHAKALKFLVASAVTGLTPDAVTVIDAEGGLLAADDPAEGTSLGADDRANLLKARIERLLEARVGYGKAVVEVSLETVTDSEQIVERVIDPDSRVAISTEVTETNTRSNDSRGGAVTVASNLPEGDGAGSGGSASSSNSETRERTNFEISETSREVIRAPGAVKRLTVAVLVDGVRTTAADGSAAWAPRDAGELDALRSLVASAVGFDAARGDEITIQSLEFEPVVPEGSPAPPGLFAGLVLDVMSLIQMTVLALVALVLGLFVIRPILASGAARPSAKSIAELPAPPSATPPDFASLPALSGEIQSGGGFADLPDLAEFGGPVDLAPPGAGVVDRLKQMITEREAESAEILRSWIEEPKEAAR